MTLNIERKQGKTIRNNEAMNIGLIDVDGHGFPNLALMKISAYHKRRGDTVDWYSIFDHLVQ